MKHGGTIALSFILLAIAGAWVIGSRLSEQTLAALAGAACGVGVAAPFGLGLGVYIGSTRSRASGHPAQTPAPPQVIVLSTPPPAAPNTPSYYPTPGSLAPARRSFRILGEEDADES
ncbi:MAG TPA: hypothetical protein VJG32_02645 [Anaerolineae bacterium]|nr:hypothetical protein [Anaerolineae bacterium]